MKNNYFNLYLQIYFQLHRFYFTLDYKWPHYMFTFTYNRSIIFTSRRDYLVIFLLTPTVDSAFTP